MQELEFETKRAAMVEELLIEANRIQPRYWHDVWHYRQLFYFLAWRDILVRYKQTAIGIGWALVGPILNLAVFTVVFGKIAKLPSDGTAPYSLLVYLGVLPAQFIASALSACGNSLTANPSMVTKIYLPRIIVPVSAVVTSFCDFLISLLVLTLMIVWHRFWPDWHVVVLPLFVAMALVASIGVGLWLCALNVEYRDFRHIIPFVVQVGMYVSPVGFSSAVIPKSWRLLYSVNPAVGIIDGFRWALLRGAAPIYWQGMLVSVMVALGFCASGVWYFRKREGVFADSI